MITQEQIAAMTTMDRSTLPKMTEDDIRIHAFHTINCWFDDLVRDIEAGEEVSPCRLSNPADKEHFIEYILAEPGCYEMWQDFELHGEAIYNKLREYV